MNPFYCETCSGKRLGTSNSINIMYWYMPWPTSPNQLHQLQPRSRHISTFGPACIVGHKPQRSRGGTKKTLCRRFGSKFPYPVQDVWCSLNHPKVPNDKNVGRVEEPFSTPAQRWDISLFGGFETRTILAVGERKYLGWRLQRPRKIQPQHHPSANQLILI